MAHQAILDRSHEVHTPSTYRLYGSCSVRAYVACDDTPYHLEQPITTGGGQNPNYNADLMNKVRAIRATREGGWRSYRTLKALIDDNPEATVSELLGMLN